MLVVALILSSFCPQELRGKTYFWFIAFPRNNIEAAQLNDSRGREKRGKELSFPLEQMVICQGALHGELSKKIKVNLGDHNRKKPQKDTIRRWFSI